MNFRRLKYFVKIVDIGSLTQAAEVLHIAQPALSQQVATLEGELNQQLLIRTKRGVTPTDAGIIPMRGPFYVSVSRPNWRCITLVSHYRGKSRLALRQEPLRHPSPCPYYRRFALNSRRSLSIFMKIVVQCLTKKTDKSPTRYGGDL